MIQLDLSRSKIGSLIERAGDHSGPMPPLAVVKDSLSLLTAGIKLVRKSLTELGPVPGGVASNYLIYAPVEQWHALRTPVCEIVHMHDIEFICASTTA